jgi:hypothetical protein
MQWGPWLRPRRWRIGSLCTAEKKRFAVWRIIAGGDLWIKEFILTYDGKPSYTVSIMEFRDDMRGKHSTLRIHSLLRRGVLNGPNGWTHNPEVREFANDTVGPLLFTSEEATLVAPARAGCGLNRNCQRRLRRKQLASLPEMDMNLCSATLTR